MESITNFFNFNILITPYIIGFIYITGAVVVPFIVVYYFKQYRLHINSSKYRLYLFVAFVVLEIFWRIFCEFFMVYFKIFLALQ
jgi:hypothetical protein